MKLLKGAQLKWWELFSSKSNILDVWSGPESASGDGRPKYSSTKQNKTKLAKQNKAFSYFWLFCKHCSQWTDFSSWESNDSH